MMRYHPSKLKHCSALTIVIVLIMTQLIVTYVECQAYESHEHGQAPKFLNKTRFQKVQVRSSGSIAEFNCKARGKPKPKVKWLKNSLPLKSRHFKDYERKRWELQVKNVVKEDEGNYTCVVFNKFGSINRTISLKVRSRVFATPPKVKDGYPENKTSLIGKDVELKCEIDYIDDSNPPLITWMHMKKVNGSYRDENEEPYKQILQRCSLGGLCYENWEDSITHFIIEDALTLVLYNVTKNMTGWYGCLVQNELGSDSDFAYVTIISEYPGKSTHHAAYITVTIVVLLVVIILCALLIIIYHFDRKYREEKRKKKEVHEAFRTVYQWTKVVLVQKSERNSQQPSLYPNITIEKKKILTKSTEPPETEYEIILPDNDRWEVDRNHVHFQRVIGEGEFGKVVKGVIDVPDVRNQNNRNLKGPIHVAVKMLKKGHSDDDLIDLLKEMEIFKHIGHHEHIVNFLGVCTQPSGAPVYLIIEYAENGNLKDFLMQFRPENMPKRNFTPHPYAIPDWELIGLPLQDMLRLAYEVSSGMLFLSEKGCIHRDLAARNVLITGERHAKIADFGLARDLQSKNYYRKTGSGRLPLKWMAPESVFDRISTTKSDVWSYGILLYEIVTLGEPPFKNVDSDLFFTYLKEGKKMAQPRNCPDNLYQIMSRCWSMDPEARPIWQELVTNMHNMYNMYKDTQPHEYIDMATIIE